MAEPKGTIWELEPHTQAKHAILRKYLDAWFPILTRWNQEALYVDGFAGPGRYSEKEDGSPLIAIKAVLEHSAKIKAGIRFVFIEDKADRADNLEAELKALRLPINLRWRVRHGKFVKEIDNILKTYSKNIKLPPAFVFIDPFGFSHTPLRVIAKIMNNPKWETLITFMYEEVNRFLTHPDEKIQKHYTELFGTDRWQKLAQLSDPKERRNQIHSLYKTQLEQQANINYVRSFEMFNNGNRTDYFLFFCTNNHTGLKKMKDSMWKVDPSGAFQFSDCTDHRQTTLFTSDPDYNQLKQLLLDRFSKQTVPIEKIERYVVEETPFRETHFKQQILRVMESNEPAEISAKHTNPNKIRRKGTYPNGTIVTFRV